MTLWHYAAIIRLILCTLFRLSPIKKKFLELGLRLQCHSSHALHRANERIIFHWLLSAALSESSTAKRQTSWEPPRALLSTLLSVALSNRHWIGEPLCWPPHICWPTQPPMGFLLCSDNVLQRTDTAISALPLFYVWISVRFTLAAGKVVKNTSNAALPHRSTTQLHFCELSRSQAYHCHCSFL